MTTSSTPITDTERSSNGTVRNHPQRWWAMAALALGTSLIVLDATVANVALPIIIRSLNMIASEAQWVSASYALVFASLMLTAGRAADLIGRRRLFVIGMSVFMLASLASGLATSAIVLIIARFVQGIGAAMIMPATTSTINTLFEGRERTAAFAIYGGTIGGMAAVGPLVGGWLATDFSWRWAFWMNVPVGAIALALALLYLPETRDEKIRRGIDWSGTVLTTVGLSAIVYGLVESSSLGWWTRSDGSLSPVPFAIGGGLVVMLLWVWTEHVRENRGAIVQSHLRLWTIGNFRKGVLVALIVSFGEMGMLFALPLVMQGALGYDAIGSGWAMMALAAGTFVISGFLPRIAPIIGARRVVQIGIALEAVGVFGLGWALPASFWGIAAWLFIYGVGVGMATAQVTNVSLDDVPRGYSGEASGMFTTLRQLGSALGVAILGGLLIGQLTTGTDAALKDTRLPEQARTAIVDAVHDSIGAAIPGLAQNPQTKPAADIARTQLIDAAKVTSYGAGAILMLGLLGSLVLTPPKGAPEDDEFAGESTEAAELRRK